jgi:hypothetical protein
MGNWRVVLLVGVVVAVVLWGASIWVKDNPTSSFHHRTTNTADCAYTIGGVQPPGCVNRIIYDYSLANTRSRYLRFAALAVVVITLASIPLLRDRERRRAAQT